MILLFFNFFYLFFCLFTTVNHHDAQALAELCLSFSYQKEDGEFYVPHKLAAYSVPFPRKRREETFQGVFNFFEMRKLKREQSDSDKTSNSLTALHCAPGGGKSFFLDELAKLNPEDLTKHCDSPNMRSILENSVPVCITFNKNSNVLLPETKDKILAKVGLCIRILWSYFIKPTYDGGSTWPLFHEFCSNRLESTLELHHVINCICGHARKGILLCVDEIIKTDNFVEDLVSYICTALDLFPVSKLNTIVSTLDILPIETSQTKSGRAVNWVSLPRLHNKDGFELFETLLQNVAPSRQKIIKQVIANCSGHPRFDFSFFF